ncbi:hypothetical protein CSUB01_09591 [Colletotrichum sublineola]|uniref:Uncharacterized protein n=1 Tax=Colletotrichum sublineola TaxID=1173701 RepID=A0A066WSY6_COLSU|nr:hypothetical protein CSUB01_09591 [Colletotrichum sublineola]
MKVSIVSLVITLTSALVAANPRLSICDQTCNALCNNQNQGNSVRSDCSGLTPSCTCEKSNAERSLPSGLEGVSTPASNKPPVRRAPQAPVASTPPNFANPCLDQCNTTICVPQGKTAFSAQCDVENNLHSCNCQDLQPVPTGSAVRRRENNISPVRRQAPKACSDSCKATCGGSSDDKISPNYPATINADSYVQETVFARAIDCQGSRITPMSGALGGAFRTHCCRLWAFNSPERICGDYAWIVRKSMRALNGMIRKG